MLFGPATGGGNVPRLSIMKKIKRLVEKIKERPDKYFDPLSVVDIPTAVKSLLSSTYGAGYVTNDLVSYVVGEIGSYVNGNAKELAVGPDGQVGTPGEFITPSKGSKRPQIADISPEDKKKLKTGGKSHYCICDKHARSILNSCR